MISISYYIPSGLLTSAHRVYMLMSNLAVCVPSYLFPSHTKLDKSSSYVSTPVPNEVSSIFLMRPVLVSIEPINIFIVYLWNRCNSR